jgi:DNA-directed RNA polymerase subunit RPC12/RpoP
MVCHLIGMDPKAETPMPMDQIIETARTTQISVGVGTRLMEWLSSHPLTVLRIQRVLRQSQRKGLFESVLSPLANALESAAVWLTPETRAAARGPSEREGPTLLIGCAVGTVTALLAAALPGMSSTIAIIAIGVPSGLLVGFGTTMVLSRNGPFLGADAIDAGLTGSLGWFVAAVAVAGGLVLPNGVATLVSGWVVLLVAVATSAVGYVFLRPATADLTTAGVLRETPSPVQEESVFVAKVIALSGADSGVPPSTETVPEPSDQQAKKVEPVRKAALVKPKRPPLKHSAIWFVPGEDDEPAGPFSAERLLEMWRLGELTDDSLCWREGMEDWRPLGQTEPFRGAIGAARHSPRLIRFKCSHCNSLIVMAKSHAGRRAKCKNCGHEVAVPEK